MGSNARRVFLGWHQAALKSAAKFLCAGVQDATTIDLSEMTVVTPGARAGRNLLAYLVEEAEGRGLPLAPPRTLTPGSLASALLSRSAPSAGSLARQLAWTKALQTADSDTLAHLVPNPPHEDNQAAWQGLAKMLLLAHADLAAELILMTEVPQRADAIPEFQEQDRWQAAGALQLEYECILEQWGFVDADLARLRAVRAGDAIEIREILLLGVPELNAATRALLRQPGNHLTALVLAPDDMADRFDELGCVIPACWEDAEIDLRPEQIRFADGPADQVDCVLQTLAGLEGEFAAPDVVVGAADPAIAPQMSRSAELQTGVRMHDAAGLAIRRTGPYRLLEAVADFAQEQRFAAFAALVRHPDVEHFLTRALNEEETRYQPADWLSALDEYQSYALPAEIDGQWRGAECRSAFAPLTDLQRGILLLLGELAGPDTLGRPLRKRADEWAPSILGLLHRAYAGRTFNRKIPSQNRTVDAALAVRNALQELRQLAGQGATLPSTTASEMIRLVLAEVGDITIADEAADEALDMVGWLELCLDPAPVAIVTGMNEGAVPAAVTRDALLPGRLRTALGLPDNHHKLARDVYLLAAIAAPRKRLALIVGRQTVSGEPLLPSRLLFHCSREETVARVRRCCGLQPEPLPKIEVISRIKPGPNDQFALQPEIRKCSVDSMSVTSFRTYLASPYLFYLERVLKLRECDDSAVEMDALSYGGIIHQILEDFAHSDARHSHDEKEIAAHLGSQLSSRGERRFGKDPAVAVWLQLDFARQRLMHFARWQAKRRAEGWIIDQEPEWKPAGGAIDFIVDGEPMSIRGKIDRIDRNEFTGDVAILDYKTGETAKKPSETHGGAGKWRDLQLPLYRHLAAELELGDNVELGYIVLPKQANGVKLCAADWDDDALEDADEAARQVVRQVRAGEFASIGDRPPREGLFAILCNPRMGAALDQPGADAEDES